MGLHLWHSYLYSSYNYNSYKQRQYGTGCDFHFADCKCSSNSVNTKQNTHSKFFGWKKPWAPWKPTKSCWKCKNIMSEMSTYCNDANILNIDLILKETCE